MGRYTAPRTFRAKLLRDGCSDGEMEVERDGHRVRDEEARVERQRKIRAQKGGSAAAKKRA